MPYKDPAVRRMKARMYQRKYELAHKKERRESNVRYRVKLKEFVRSYKLLHPCVKCGEADPVCLDFHHTNPSNKDVNMADAVRLGWGMKKFQSELDKCIVLCANCHRKLHAMGAGVRFELTTSVRM